MSTTKRVVENKTWKKFRPMTSIAEVMGSNPWVQIHGFKSMGSNLWDPVQHQACHSIMYYGGLLRLVHFDPAIVFVYHGFLRRSLICRIHIYILYLSSKFSVAAELTSLRKKAKMK